MPEGLVIECPVCGAQRPFNVDLEGSLDFLEPRLKTSGDEHLKHAHDQDYMDIFQWNEIVDTMFEAEIPHQILEDINEDNRDPKWDDYGLTST